MKITLMCAISAIIGFGSTFLIAQEIATKQEEVHVLCSLGIKTAIDKLRPQAELAIGHPLSIQFDSSAALKSKIQGGAPFDVAILTPAIIDDLAKEGKIQMGTHTDIASTGLGIAVQAGAPKPDISTPEALKRTLLQAKSITYGKDGAGKLPIASMLERLGITDDVKSKTILTVIAGEPTQNVADGKAEIGFGLITEILPVQGAELVGPFPPAFQTSVVMTAGIGLRPANAEAAHELIKFLTGTQASSTIKTTGMEPAAK